MIAGAAAQAAERLSAWTDPPPKRVAIAEWDSLEQAEAFFKSKATDLGLDRDKAINSTDMRSKQ